MFTGLIETTAPVVSYLDGELCLRTDLPLRHGDSVGVDGCCLTVSSNSDDLIVFHISAETIARTHFATLQTGQELNIERSMALQDRLHGHFVTGHIDAAAKVKSLTGDVQTGIQLLVALPLKYRHLAWEKGYCALQGVSLTINRVAVVEDELLLAFFLIPTTLQKTNLRLLHPAQLLNVEYDMHAKYLHNLYQDQRAPHEANI